MYRANQHRRRNQPRRATPLGYLVATAACLFCAACRGQPAGGIIPSDSPVVTAALQWARALQSDDEQLFGSTLNPDRLEPPSAQTLASYSDVLVSTFATCGTDAPKTEGLVTDGTRGRERYMVIGRYGSKCLQRFWQWQAGPYRYGGIAREQR